jgi:hypothetical protein
MSRAQTGTCTSEKAAVASPMWGAREEARDFLADLLGSRRFSLALFLSRELAATGIIEAGDARFISSTVQRALENQHGDVESN